MKKITPILFDSYLALIKNSDGSHAFRNFYAYIDGKKEDIVKNGRLSCAFFVSSIFYFFKLIKSPHMTVDGLVKDMIQSGWKETKKLKIGSVLIWEALKSKEGMHRHVGFYLGEKKAISNSSQLRKPVLHHWTFGLKDGKPIRKIEKIYWHKKLS